MGITKEQKKAAIADKKAKEKIAADKAEAARKAAHTQRLIAARAASELKRSKKLERVAQHKAFVLAAPARREQKRQDKLAQALRQTERIQERTNAAIAACRKKYNIPEDTPLEYNPKTGRFKIGIKAEVKDGKAEFNLSNGGAS